jgi:predicted CopG family antitoxin
MTDMTTIQVSADVRDLLEAKKQGNEPLNDVLRRELGQVVDSEVTDLTAYVEDDRTKQIEAVVELLHDEFNLDEVYHEAGKKENEAVLEFRHHGTDMPLVTIKTSRSGSYAIYIRGPDRELFRWKGAANDFDPDSEYDTSELRRLVNGAYQKQENS